MKLLLTLLLVLICFGCNINENYQVKAKATVFSIDSLDKIPSLEFPIDTADKAFAYAISQNSFEEVNIEELQKRGYKKFEFRVYNRTPLYLIKPFERMHANGQISKETFDVNVKNFDSFGNYWQVVFVANDLMPSFTCSFSTLTSGVVVKEGTSRCGYNK